MHTHRILVGLFLSVIFMNAAYAQRQKVIMDTDLGGDIDDAFALALVLASPEFEVLGITTDHGMTDKRAQIACKMLYDLGMEHIPVAVGRPTPTIVGQDDKSDYSPQFHWAEGFDTVKPIEQPAADFIIENLRRYPGEIILFTVGPVPNMADIIQKDPEALKLAKGIYSMFGSFYVGYGDDPIPDIEWNVRADVESGRQFAESGALITYAGLDVTNIPYGEELRYKLLMRQSPLTDALCGLYSLWGNETPTLFDVVPVAMVLWPELFEIRPAHVKVIEGGYTIVDESAAPNARIGVSVNKQALLERITQRYLRQNFGR